MSRFFSEKYAALTPYVPGEQPRDMQYLKLNTNESPFPPIPAVVEAAREEASRAHLYSDPTALALRQAIANRLGVTPDMVIAVNGSDEALNFAFMAFCDGGAVFPDVTYGFYPVFARLNGIPYEEIPLRDDFTVDPEDYAARPGKTVFLANPNAPTGIFLPLASVERIAASDPGRVLVVDEAYVDFGGESAVTLIPQYPNLLVVRTFSKSRSLAGARLGFAVGQPALIADLETIRNSTNPYNVNRMTLAMGTASLAHDDVNLGNCKTVADVRDRTAEVLRSLGFEVLPSSANFLFARHPGIGGEDLYRKLRARGILVRHFSLPRIRDYNRITVGSAEQMKTFVAAVREILEDPS
ncbi:MAG: histidinol-phosphate transaminase [Clostridiales bacterium]|nr:histidinol-phosphate transaminase [Clostridiales bacterium]